MVPLMTTTPPTALAEPDGYTSSTPFGDHGHYQTPSGSECDHAAAGATASSSPACAVRPESGMYYHTHQEAGVYSSNPQNYMDPAAAGPVTTDPLPSMMHMHAYTSYQQYAQQQPPPPQDMLMYPPQAHVATTLKRKHPSMYNNNNSNSSHNSHSYGSHHHNTASSQIADTMVATEKLCDVCQYPDPILYVPKCGHRFHSRCVHIWPLEHCAVCDTPTMQVHLLKTDMKTPIDARSGKWTKAEERFIEVILTEFDRNSFPLANGTPVRLLLAKLLNCSTMRLSKKFQKNALGKRTFRIPKISKGQIAMQFDRHDHVRRQKEFSHWESVFRRELVEQFRRDNNTDEGAFVETDNLRRAVKQFWIANFLKFAVMIGQPVKGLNISDAKKRKFALQMLRDGNYDELLHWTSSPTMASAAPPRTKRLRTSDNTTLEPYSMPSAPLAPLGSSSYGYLPPPSSSYPTQSSFSSAYPSTYSSMAKPTDKQFPHVHQAPPSHFHNHSMPQYNNHHNYSNTAATSSHSDSHSHPEEYASEDPTASESYSSMLLNPLPYRVYENTTECREEAAPSNAAMPWDELLDDISESNGQMVDPALQAWSTLQCM